jgi:hypothetical protein
MWTRLNAYKIYKLVFFLMSYKNKFIFVICLLESSPNHNFRSTVTYIYEIGQGFELCTAHANCKHRT